MSLYAIIIICNGVLCERRMTTQIPRNVTIETCADDARRDAERWVREERPGYVVEKAWCGMSRGSGA